MTETPASDLVESLLAQFEAAEARGDPAEMKAMYDSLLNDTLKARIERAESDFEQMFPKGVTPKITWIMLHLQMQTALRALRVAKQARLALETRVRALEARLTRPEAL